MKQIKNIYLAATVILVFFFMMEATVFAQPQRGPMYQWGSEKTIEGTVKEVISIQGKRPSNEGIRLVVETKDDVLTIIVGPMYYLSDKGYTPKVGDRVSVLGSRLDINGEAIMVAKSITVGSQTIELRDSQGMPLWRGGSLWKGQRGASPGAAGRFMTSP